jgi:hypothetical protein
VQRLTVQEIETPLALLIRRKLGSEAVACVGHGLSFLKEEICHPLPLKSTGETAVTCHKISCATLLMETKQTCMVKPYSNTQGELSYETPRTKLRVCRTISISGSNEFK